MESVQGFRVRGFGVRVEIFGGGLNDESFSLLWLLSEYLLLLLLLLFLVVISIVVLTPKAKLQTKPLSKAAALSPELKVVPGRVRAIGNSNTAPALGNVL